MPTAKKNSSGAPRKKPGKGKGKPTKKRSTPPVVKSEPPKRNGKPQSKKPRSQPEESPRKPPQDIPGEAPVEPEPRKPKTRPFLAFQGAPQSDDNPVVPSYGKGRPALLTPELIIAFEGQLKRCFYTETALACLGIHRNYVKLWRNRGRVEAERLYNNPGSGVLPNEQLYLNFYYMLTETQGQNEQRVVEGIEAHGAVHWQALAWIAERRYKHWRKPSDRLEVTGKDGENLSAVQIFLPENGRGKPPLRMVKNHITGAPEPPPG